MQGQIKGHLKVKLRKFSFKNESICMFLESLDSLLFQGHLKERSRGGFHCLKIVLRIHLQIHISVVHSYIL